VATNITITNAALAQIGTHSQIISMVDGSEEARYANLLYLPLKDFLLTEGDYDFSSMSENAVLIGVTGVPWGFSYAYPTGALRIRSLTPISYDEFNPLSIEYNITSALGIKYIFTKVQVSKVVYTYSAPEDTWDPIFTEAFTRFLGSALAFALENRIEASKEKLSEALNFAGIANLRDP
jgi:hypothetical protein